VFGASRKAQFCDGKLLRFFWDCAPKKWPYGQHKSEVEEAYKPKLKPRYFCD
jgi:hypothetical protein